MPFEYLPGGEKEINKKLIPVEATLVTTPAIEGRRVIPLIGIEYGLYARTIWVCLCSIFSHNNAQTPFPEGVKEPYIPMGYKVGCEGEYQASMASSMRKLGTEVAVNCMVSHL